MNADFPPPTTTQTIPNTSFTLSSYNVLAQALVSRPRYPWATITSTLRWANRCKLFFDQFVDHFSSDIYTLQEVDTNVYQTFWFPLFYALNYTVFFSTRGPKAKHGLLTAYKRDKFIALNSHTLQFDKLGLISRDPLEADDIAKDNIAQVLVLLPLCQLNEQNQQNDPLSLLVLTNNHLFWKYTANYPKTRQVMLLRTAVSYILTRLPSKLSTSCEKIAKMHEIIKTRSQCIKMNNGVEVDIKKSKNINDLKGISKVNQQCINHEEIYLSQQINENCLFSLYYDQNIPPLPIFDTVSRKIDNKCPEDDHLEFNLTANIVNCGDFNLTSKTTALIWHQQSVMAAILPVYDNNAKLETKIHPKNGQNIPYLGYSSEVTNKTRFLSQNVVESHMAVPNLTENEGKPEFLQKIEVIRYHHNNSPNDYINRCKINDFISLAPQDIGVVSHTSLDHTTPVITPQSQSAINDPIFSPKFLSPTKIEEKEALLQEIHLLYRDIRHHTYFSPYFALFTPLHTITFLITLGLLHVPYEYIPFDGVNDSNNTIFTRSDQMLLFQWSSITEDFVHCFPHYMIDGVYHWFYKKFGNIKIRQKNATFEQNEQQTTTELTSEDQKIIDIIMNIDDNIQIGNKTGKKLENSSEPTLEPTMDASEDNNLYQSQFAEVTLLQCYEFKKLLVILKNMYIFMGLYFGPADTSETSPSHSLPINYNTMLAGGADLLKNVYFHQNPDNVTNNGTFDEYYTKCKQLAHELVTDCDFHFSILSVVNNREISCFFDQNLKAVPQLSQLSSFYHPTPMEYLMNDEERNYIVLDDDADEQKLKEINADQSIIQLKRVKVLYDVENSAIVPEMQQSSILQRQLSLMLVMNGILTPNVNGVESPQGEANMANPAQENNVMKYIDKPSLVPVLPQSQSRTELLEIQRNLLQLNSRMKAAYSMTLTRGNGSNMTENSANQHKEQKYTNDTLNFINLTQLFVQRLSDLIILSLPQIVPNNHENMNVYSYEPHPYPKLVNIYCKYPFLPIESNTDLDMRENMNNMTKKVQFLNDEIIQFSFQYSQYVANSMLLHSNNQKIAEIKQNCQVIDDDHYGIPLCKYCLPTFLQYIGNQNPEQIAANYHFFNFTQDCYCQSLDKGLPLSNHRIGWCGVLDHILVSTKSVSLAKNQTLENNHQKLNCTSLRRVEDAEYAEREGSLPTTYYPSDHFIVGAQFEF